VSTLAAAGKKVVGVWLTNHDGHPCNLQFSDHSYGICHIPEAELDADEHGSFTLVYLGSGLFWAPDDKLPLVDHTTFDSKAHTAGMTEQAAAKKAEANRLKEEQDERDRQAYIELEQRVQERKSQLVLEHKRQRTT
jgi:hypothetical protein